jgi:peptide/nickel transport system substrate-binding protein
VTPRTKFPRVSRAARVASLALLAAIALAGCAGGGPAANSKDGGTLVIGIESETDVLDPQVAGGWVTWRVNRQMYEPLVMEDLSVPSADAAVPALKPGLAKSWEISPDGLKYTFHIRKGVTFHDGTPLNAAAVEYNIRRMWDPKSTQYYAKAAGQTSFVWSSVAAVASTDDMTLVVTMRTPFSPFLRILAQGGQGSTAIISPTALKKWGNGAIADHPSGTGPFKFEERVRGERISLVRNDHYWGDVPHLARVVFRPIPDAAARTSALRSGAVDIIAVPSPDSVQGLVKDGYQLSEGAPPHVWYLAFNMNDKYTSNKLVRQAINLAIDRKGMAKDLLKNTVNPAYDVQAPANDAYIKRTDVYTRDVTKAKTLLAEAGYPHGFTTTMMTSVDGSGQIIPVPMAEYIQQNLAEIGIDMKIKSMEWISYLGTWAKGTPPGTGMAQQSWGMTTPYWLYIATSSKLIAPNGPNVGGYSNSKLDAVMAQAIQAPSEEAAIPFWKQANDIVTEDAVLAPIVNDKAPYILAPRVKGFVSASEEWYDLTKVSLN